MVRGKVLEEAGCFPHSYGVVQVGDTLKADALCIANNKGMRTKITCTLLQLIITSIEGGDAAHTNIEMRQTCDKL